MHQDTLAVHAGRHPDDATGAVTTPIHLSTTFERNADGSYPRGFEYGRSKNPNRTELEQCLAALEGGREALCFASGMAATNAVIQTLAPGDHLLYPDDVYWGMRKLLGAVYDRSGLEATPVDFTDREAVRAAWRANTKLVWVETPSNPLLKVTDLHAIAHLAKERGALMVCDSTFASPILQRPFDHGVDLVMHSTTKYLGGHSDLTGGAVITKEPNAIFDRMKIAQVYAGAVPSPFDCWLALRGIATLGVRVRSQASSAGAIAAFLASHQAVERVHYPGLPSHPGHAVAARQMRDFGGMMSFQVKAGEAAAMDVAARCQLFTRATSLGGVHSLIEHRASIEAPGSKTPRNLLRVSVGLEHCDDLIADLAQALH